MHVCNYIITQELAATLQILFKETSALDGTNIQAAFEDLVRAIMNGGIQCAGSKGGPNIVIHPVDRQKKPDPNHTGGCAC